MWSPSKPAVSCRDWPQTKNAEVRELAPPVDATGSAINGWTNIRTHIATAMAWRFVLMPILSPSADPSSSEHKVD